MIFHDFSRPVKQVRIDAYSFQLSVNVGIGNSTYGNLSAFVFKLRLHQGRRERRARGGATVPSFPPPHFLELNVFSHVKSEKFLHVNNMWDFSLFIEQDISDKK